jgi:hypothetical protein
MPHKHNAARRHRISKMQFKVTNWQEYEAGLRRRGSMTLWVTPEALSGWAASRRKTRGGQPRYSDLAIETTLMLGMVFGLRLRQSEGLLSSVLDLMGLDLPVPDHTTLSRRARTWMQRWCGDQQMCGIQSLIRRLFRCRRRCLATSGSRACAGEHSVQNGDADRGLRLLSKE